jgi:peroxiredoxin (alkyl hydroperoxide reductase subunit C)
MGMLVTRTAPDFTATAVMPDNSFDSNFTLSALRGRYVVLFFYPFDFSFVCPSEILAFDHRLQEFAERECDIVGVSVDSHFTHLAWKETPVDDGGIGPIRYPLVSDFSKRIAREYDVLVDDTVALRASFLIDREGVVRHTVINDMDLGRNIEEMLRTLDALRFIDTNDGVCPANWEKGDDTMQATPAGVKKYLKAFGAEL